MAKSFSPSCPWGRLARGSPAGAGSRPRCGQCSTGSAWLLDSGCPLPASSASSCETCPGLFLSSLYLAFKDTEEKISFHHLDVIFNTSLPNLRGEILKGKKFKSNHKKVCMFKITRRVWQFPPNAQNWLMFEEMEMLITHLMYMLLSSYCTTPHHIICQLKKTLCMVWEMSHAL
jgi:hypothetical protein